ncbi:hypothetical protein Nepgr_008408 [Nepenthes gracilis]|uniref:GDSL esterase/lipase EXL3 n=1 Tax=Nepenthes gracilis TaxID=150966 RepID=A0AAD3XJ85_NEPGR|nr:hypothetical protein Nepgr_008408 [Nepenthes gracilis]
MHKMNHTIRSGCRFPSQTIMKSPNTSSSSTTRIITAAAIAILAQLFACLYLSSSNAYALSLKDLKPPAVIVFGDSIVDAGNNNYLPTVGKCNFPPYGRDFEGGKPTGRYSNGKVASDLIVEELGIKELLPPYLDPTLQLNDLLTGVNFASGGSGYDPISAQLAELYGQGARRIGVTNVPPLGCLPSQRTLAGGPQRSCVEEYNQAATLFNSKLYSEIQSLNRMLPGLKIAYLDIYNPLLDLINNPSQSGFEITNKGCCGTGNIEASVLCNRYEPSTCTDDKKYIFWDSFHPTEKTYKIVVNQVINKSFNSFF